MNIQKISLQNFRCYHTFEATLHPQLTVFVGNNGAGKTALLDALAIALGTFTLQFDKKQGIGISVSDARLCYHDMGEIIDTQGQFPVCIAAEGKLDDQSLSWTRTLQDKGGKTSLGQAKEMTAQAKKHVRYVQEGVHTALPLISYYGTGRLFAQKKEKRDQSTIQKFSRELGYLDCLSSASNEKMMIKWFEKMTLKKYQQTTDISSLRAVEDALCQCFSLITGYNDTSIQFNLDTHQIEVTYTDDSGQRSCLPINLLSDGYKTTLSMIGDIAYRMAVLNPWVGDDVLTKTPGVVLIDEVDLHLHPIWQQRILSDLQTIFPNVQFIVTTHAPVVISSVKRENLRILSHSQAVLPSEEVYGSSSNDVLETIMDADNRPREIKKQFSEIYQAIDNEAYHHAQQLLDALINKIGENDPEITSTQVTLALESFEVDR